MSDNSEVVKKSGMIPAIIGCIAGVLAILTIGIVFFPIALVCTIIALILSIKTKYGAAIGISILSLLLTIAGFVFSPTLWALVFGSAIIKDPQFQNELNTFKQEIQQIEKVLDNNNFQSQTEE